MFHKKGTLKYFPYTAWHSPKTWQTLNGTFTTNGKGKIQVKFFEYSNSKVVELTPDLVQYEKGAQNKPEFDFILGTKTLNELGIILDFKRQIITVDEVVLPMQTIEELQKSRERALKHNNALASHIEPVSVQQATKRVVYILDAKYDKADLQSIVKDSCMHLSIKHQQLLLGLYSNMRNCLMVL